MTKLRYRPGRGWFKIVEWLSGYTVWGTNVHLPDRDGCYVCRLLIGPYETAKEATQCPMI